MIATSMDFSLRALFAIVLLGTVGCHQAPLQIPPTVAPASANCDAEYPAVWKSAGDVLRRNRFRLDRTDMRTGRITTHAVGSQHFFEFWRRDVATSRDFWEATLCPIRRRANVAIQPHDDGTSCRVEVTVRKERYSTPERQVNSSGSAFQLFRASLPAAHSGRPVAPEDSYWIDLGRDPAMEQRLLAMILDRVSGRSGGDDRQAH